MNLTITQDNTRTETINSSIIDKLYEIAFAASSDPNSTVSLTGRLESPKGYAAKVEWLNTEFSPNLTITVPTSGLYILFEDSAIESLLISGGFSADGTGISLTDAANATFTGWNSGGTFYNNSDITKFNEFGYFTKANTNPPACLFKLCTNLSEIDLSLVTKITDQEFSYTSLQDVNMPNLLTTDGNNLFNECGVVTVTSLGNTITKIPNNCFFGCEFLTTVTLPQTVTEIGLGAFSTYNKYWTRKLTTVNGLDHVTIFGDGCFYGLNALAANFSLLKNATSIVGNTFYNCSNITGEVDLPNIVSLSNEVFWNTKPTKIKCLGKVAAIPNSAFAASNNASDGIKQSLTEVYLPYECTSIGYFSFGNRTRLTTVKLYTLSIDNWVDGETPAYGGMTRITSIGREAFRYTAISGALNLPSLATIDLYAFAQTSISSITDLGSITSVPDMCFNNCDSLTTVTLPNSCTNIGSGAFAYCDALTSIELGGTTTIGNLAFIADPSLATVTGTSNLTSIGNNAFLNCPITGSVSLPNLMSLGSDAFNSTRISSIDLTGSTITSLPVRVFLNCTSLSKIKLPTTVTYLNELWSRNIPSTLYISGLDNVSTHSTYNWTLDNTTILNPIKISVITGNSLLCWTDNSRVIKIHSYYEPLRTSTRQNSLVTFGAPKNTLFVYNCLGGNGSFTIGLLYYRDITSFGDATFFRCIIENLVINNITPPVLDNSDTTFSGESYWLNWGNSIFGNLNASSDAVLHEHAIIGTLWVPDSAVATYQADPLYSSLTIKGINTKTNGVDYDLPRYADFAAWEAAEEAAAAQGGHAPLGLIEAWM